MFIFVIIIITIIITCVINDRSRGNKKEKFCSTFIVLVFFGLFENKEFLCFVLGLFGYVGLVVYIFLRHVFSIPLYKIKGVVRIRD